MDSRAWNVGAACFAGATIGWLVMAIGGFGPAAVVLSTVIAGLVGYFLTDVERTRSTARLAWKAAVAVARVDTLRKAATFARGVVLLAVDALAFVVRPLVQLRPAAIIAVPAAVLAGTQIETAFSTHGPVDAVTAIVTLYGTSFLLLAAASYLVVSWMILTPLSREPKLAKWFPAREQMAEWVNAYQRTMGADSDTRAWDSR